jgi:hypothetical protein
MEKDVPLYSYVYIVQTRQFIDQNLPVYKIGRTDQQNFTRFRQYPRGTKIIALSDCSNSGVIEAIILNAFRNKYKPRLDHGSEYFEGNINEMLTDFHDILRNDHSGHKQPEIEDKNNINCSVILDSLAEEIRNKKNAVDTLEYTLEFYKTKLVDFFTKKITSLAIENEESKMLKNEYHDKYLEEKGKAESAQNFCLELIKDNKILTKKNALLENVSEDLTLTTYKYKDLCDNVLDKENKEFVEFIEMSKMIKALEENNSLLKDLLKKYENQNIILKAKYGEVLKQLKNKS